MTTHIESECWSALINNAQQLYTKSCFWTGSEQDFTKFNYKGSLICEMRMNEPYPTYLGL